MKIVYPSQESKVLTIVTHVPFNIFFQTLCKNVVNFFYNILKISLNMNKCYLYFSIILSNVIYNSYRCLKYCKKILAIFLISVR